MRLSLQYSLFLSTMRGRAMEGSSSKFAWVENVSSALLIGNKILVSSTIVFDLGLFHHLIIVRLQFHQGWLVSYSDTTIPVALVLPPFSCSWGFARTCCSLVWLVLLLFFLIFIFSSSCSSPPFFPQIWTLKTCPY